MNESHSKVLLLVEDNPLDAHMTEHALMDCQINLNIHVVTDGIEAMNFLRGVGKYAGLPRPDLVLLDLNLPGKDGRTVLSEMKADADLRRIPVVILSTSQAPEDVIKAYDLHANSYVSKPVELDLFTAAIKSIQQFWLSTALLPTRPHQTV